MLVTGDLFAFRPIYSPSQETDFSKTFLENLITARQKPMERHRKHLPVLVTMLFDEDQSPGE
eukprot:2080895-Amphidinium_carterae.1